MNRQDIIRMARQAGSLIEAAQEKDLLWLERFAALVASAEREKFCATLRQLHDSYSLASDSNAIRARGQSMTLNTIYFSTGPSGIEVLRLSKDGVWVNPDIPVEDAAKLVLNALDYNIKVLVQKAVEEEREACAKVCDDLDKMRGYSYADKCAAHIRARGQA